MIHLSHVRHFVRIYILFQNDQTKKRNHEVLQECNKIKSSVKRLKRSYHYKKYKRYKKEVRDLKGKGLLTESEEEDADEDSDTSESDSDESSDDQDENEDDHENKPIIVTC